MRYRHTRLGTMLGRRFNHTPGLSTYDGYLTKWPSVLGPRPDDATLQQWMAEWDALPPEEKDPRLKLMQDIQNATTIAAIKQILMKVVG